MPNLGGGELLIVAAVVMLLFGAKKLPEFARSLGRAKGEFKKGLDSDDDEAKPASDPARVPDDKP